MTKPRVEVLPIEQGATPDPNNVNKHTQKGGRLLGNSLRKRGAFRSIASAGKGVEVPVVGAGNFTLENAVDAGFTEVVNIHVTGNQLVNVVRDDIEPGSPEFYALAIEDNEIGKQSYNPDIDILAALTAGDSAVLAALRNEDKIFGSVIDDMNLRAGNLFLDAEENEEGEKRPKMNNNVYSITVPCSKEERDRVISILNDVKREKSFATSTDALLFVLEQYANS